jgi:hypothetical protein
MKHTASNGMSDIKESSLIFEEHIDNSGFVEPTSHFQRNPSIITFHIRIHISLKQEISDNRLISQRTSLVERSVAIRAEMVKINLQIKRVDDLQFLRVILEIVLNRLYLSLEFIVLLCHLDLEILKQLHQLLFLTLVSHYQLYYSIHSLDIVRFHQFLSLLPQLCQLSY